MASAAAAIFQQRFTAGQALAPMDSSSSTSGSSGTSGTSSSGSSGSAGDSATISANDFLTLLVTEMQNQDPTADTDPNEYINQLVQVNSLEQLIDINQTLSSDVGAPSSSSSGGAATQAAGGATANPAQTALQTGSGSGAAAKQTDSAAARANALSGATQPGRSPLGTAAMDNARGGVGGNLGIPATSAAALRVGHALDGRTRRPIGAGASPGTQ